MTPTTHDVAQSPAPRAPIARDLITWAVVRILVLSLLALPAAAAIPSDLVLFSQWSHDLGAGALPSDDMWQYPPGVALLLAAIGVLGLGVVGVLAVNFMADAFVLVALRGTRGALLWALAPLAVGPIMLTRLDNVSTLSAVLGLTTTATAASGVWLGLGTAMKVWPGFLIGSFQWAGTLKRAGAALVTFAGVAVAAFLIFGTDTFLSNQRDRGLQAESVAAWPFLVAKGMGAPVQITFRFGAFEVVSPVADAVAHWLPVVSLVAVALVTSATWRSKADVHEITALCLVLSLLVTSRVLSPQFSVWMIGILCVVVAGGLAPRSLIICIMGSALMGQLLYPYVYADIIVGWRWVGFAIQTARLGLLVAALTIALMHWRRALALPPAGADVPRPARG